MLQQIKFEKQFIVRDFDDTWLTHSIKQMDGKDNSGRKKAIKKYSEYKSGKSDDWIYLQGNSNSGKTYVASQICVDIARAEGGPICFIDSSKRFKELLDMSYKEKGKFDELLDRFSNCPVLVIDDFGNGFYNDYIRDGILFPIISNRAKKRLFTIFTSSYSYDDIITILGTTKAGAIKMKQIVETIKNKAGIEINLGDFSIY
jgi:primosomal protein DnaI